MAQGRTQPSDAEQKQQGLHQLLKEKKEGPGAAGTRNPHARELVSAQSISSSQLENWNNRRPLGWGMVLPSPAGLWDASPRCWRPAPG